MNHNRIVPDIKTSDYTPVKVRSSRMIRSSEILRIVARIRAGIRSAEVRKFEGYGKPI